MKPSHIIAILCVALIIGVVAWWSFEEVPAEPIVLPQPPVEQHLQDQPLRDGVTSNQIEPEPNQESVTEAYDEGVRDDVGLVENQVENQFETISNEVFRVEYNVQGMVRTVVLQDNKTVIQYCETMLMGCVGATGTTTMELTEEEYEAVLEKLRTISQGAMDTPEPGVLSEATYFAEHTVAGIRIEHTAEHPVVTEVESILNSYLMRAGDLTS
jgi:hypothetical protein